MRAVRRPKACDTTVCRYTVHNWGQHVSERLGNVTSCGKPTVSQFTVFMMPHKAVT